MVELRLDSVEDCGMPQDCFVSVRVGDTQKLSRLANSRVYRFPKAGDRRYGKVEVFRRIGACNVDVDPSNSDLRELAIDCGEAGFGKLGLKISVSGESKGAQPEAAEPASPGEGKKVKAAKEYLSRHRLEVRLAEAMQAVLREQPADPAEFLAGKLTQTKDMAGGIKLPPLKPGKQEEKDPDLDMMPSKPPVASKLGDLDGPMKAAAPRPPQKLEPLQAAAPKPAATKAAPAAVLPFSGFYNANFDSIGDDAFAKLHAKFPAKPRPTPAAAPAPTPAPAAIALNHLKPSVGTWLVQIAHRARAAPAPAELAAPPAATTFKRRPSVGTWLAPAPPVAAAKSAEAKVEAAPAPEQVPAFKRLPSVGTWLQPLPPSAKPAAAPTVAPVKQDSVPAPPAAPAFKTLPSVGTWLAPLPKAVKQAASAQGAPEETTASTFARRPSVGTWLAMTPPAPAVVAAVVASQAAPEQAWCRKPSVGTWLARPACGAAPAAAQQQPPAAAAAAPKPTFARRPSVGTWLATPSFVKAAEERPVFVKRPSVGTWLAARRP